MIGAVSCYRYAIAQNLSKGVYRTMPAFLPLHRKNLSVKICRQRDCLAEGQVAPHSVAFS